MNFEMTLKYPFVFLVGFLATYLLTPLVGRLARAIGMVDIPDERRIHKHPVPRGGGVAVFIGFHAACAAVLLMPWARFESTMTAVWWWHFLIMSGVLLLIGLADDRWNIRPVVKLTGQTAVALLGFWFGMRVGGILGFGLPVWLDLAVTVVWFLVLINAFNLIDGIDGLAAGLAGIGAIGMAGLLLFRHSPGDAMILLGLVGACGAFLRYNFAPASIFLGDAGSMFVGLTLAAVALATVAKATAITMIAVPLLAVGVPIFDTALAVWRRTARRMLSPTSSSPSAAMEGRIFEPDLDHIHHRLLRLGLSPRTAATWLYVLSAALVGIGLLSMVYRSRAFGIYILAFVAATYVAVKHLARAELWDTGRVVIQGLRRPANRVLAVVLYPALDLVVLAGALASAAFLSSPRLPPTEFRRFWFDQIPLWVGMPFLALALTRTYSRVWSRARMSEYVLLAVALTAGALVAVGISLIAGTVATPLDIGVFNLDAAHGTTVIVGQAVPRGQVLQFIIYVGTALLLLAGTRAFPRAVLDGMAWAQRHYPAHTASEINVLLYGAGDRAMLYLHEMSLRLMEGPSRRRVVGLLDDDPNLRGRLVHGYRVFGGVDCLSEVIQSKSIHEIVLTARIEPSVSSEVLRVAAGHKVAVLRWHTEAELVSMRRGEQTG